MNSSEPFSQMKGSGGGSCQRVAFLSLFLSPSVFLTGKGSGEGSRKSGSLPSRDFFRYLFPLFQVTYKTQTFLLFFLSQKALTSRFDQVKKIRMSYTRMVWMHISLSSNRKPTVKENLALGKKTAARAREKKNLFPSLSYEYMRV